MSNGLGELGKLTSGEKLLIARHRRGETQAEAAKEFSDVTTFVYGCWERDEKAEPGRYQQSQPKINGRIHLRPNERCLLYRRRCGKYQREVAADLGCSRRWVNLMERGLVSCDDLIWHWEH